MNTSTSYQSYDKKIQTQALALISTQHPVLSLSANYSRSLIQKNINEISSSVKNDAQLSPRERTDLNTKIQALNTQFNYLPNAQNLSYFRIC